MTHLDNCEQLGDGFYRQVLEQCWQQLDTRLDREAQAISDTEPKQRHYLAMQDVRFKADQVATLIARQNQDNFIRFRQTLALQGPSHSHNAASALAGEQRDSRILGRAAHNILQADHSALGQLNKRLALLRGGQRCTNDNNPLAPTVLCLAFQHAVRNVDIDPRIRLILFEIFAELLEREATSFYQRVNHYLVDSDVLPNLLAVANPTDRESEQSPLSQNHNVELENQLEQARKTLLADMQWPAAIVNALNQPGILPTSIYISACTLLQRQIAAHVDFQQDQLIDPESSKRQYYKYLVAHMSRHRAGVNRELLLNVELLTRLFQTISDEDELPISLRCMLSFLYAPYIKLALTDRTFFLNSQHPARRLLDILLHQGTRWLSSNADDPSVIDTLRGLVSTLACDLSDDKTAFSHTLDELRQYLGLVEQRAHEVEQREAQSQAGMESLDRARARAQQQLRVIFDEHQVNPQLSEHLSGPCIDYMTYILLQHEEGRYWTQALRLIKGIALSVRDQLPAQNLIQFQRGQQRLFNTVRKTLIESGYEGMLAQDLLASLQKAHQQVLHSLARGTGIEENNSEGAANRDDASTLQRLVVGQWYRFEDRPHYGGIQLKLAWHSQGCARALFVDASGKRRRLEFADTLLRTLGSGDLREANLPSTRHSEDVLQAVLHQLRLDSLRRRFSNRPGTAGIIQQKIC